MRRLKLFVVGSSLLLMFGGSLAGFGTAHVAAAYNPFSSNCSDPATRSSPACTANGQNPVSGKNGILHKATQIVSVITGMVAILLFVIGALMFEASNGDPGKAETAKNTLVYAVIGIIISFTAQSIVIFVLNNT